MKNLFNLILFLVFNLFGTLLSAQTADYDYDELDSIFVNPFEVKILPSPTPCLASELSNVSQLKLADGSVLVYFRFKSDLTSTFVVYDLYNKSTLSLNHISPNEVLVKVNSKGDAIQTSEVNSCGENVAQKIYLEAKEGNTGQDMVNVSPELSNLLGVFSKGKVPLSQILSNDNSVSVFEKIAFYQKFVLSGLPLNISPDRLVNSTKDNTNYSDLWNSVFSEKVKLGECKCETISTQPNHLLGKITTSNAPYYYNYIPTIILNGSTHSIGSGASSTKNLQILGASKWMDVITQGYRTTKTSEKKDELTVGHEKIANSGVRGEITVHLVCMDGNQLPSSCSCDKDGTFSYRYNSIAKANAALHSGGPWKSYRRAFAFAEDFAMTYCYEGTSKGDSININSLVPIEGISSGASAFCETDKNPEFWTNIGNLGNSVIDVITEDGNVYSWKYNFRNDTIRKSPTTGNDTIMIVQVKDSTRVTELASESEVYKNLLANIIKVINTPFFKESTCSDETQYIDMDGYFHFRLKPNRPLTFVLMSRGKTISGGRRSWISMGQIASGYSMSVMTKPGRTDGANIDCCSPWTGSYLCASPFIHETQADHSRFVAGQLGIQGGFLPGNPNGLESYLSVRGQSGNMSRPAISANCEVAFTPRSSFNSPSSLSDLSNVTLFDLQGKKLSNFQIPSNVNDFQESVKQYILAKFHLPEGIYLYSFFKDGKIATYKLYLGQ